MPRCPPAAVALILALAPAAAVGADPIPGPINARVVSVYDGDTLTVDAEPWPGLTARTSVRVAGVDTPEIRGKCQTEKDQAIRARDFVRATVGATVQLTNIRPGKYAGRVVADVWVSGRTEARRPVDCRKSRPPVPRRASGRLVPMIADLVQKSDGP